MPRSIAKTNSFRALQKSIGGATLYLNTVAVGLELTVPNQVNPIPAGLHISWNSPSTLTKRRELASQARTFVLRAVLVTACDALDTFIRDFSRTTWLNFPLNVVDIATKATTRQGKIEWSVFDRLKALSDDLGLEDVDPPFALLSLATRWRNAVVHAGNAKYALESDVRAVLNRPEAVQRLLGKARFDIASAVRRFDAGESPTLKDVTTALAFMQDACRQLDQTAINRVAHNAEQVEALLMQALRKRFVTRGELDEFWGIHRSHEWADGEPGGSYADKQSRETRSSTFELKWHRKFGNLLNSIGFSESTATVSHAVPERTLGHLMGMSASEFARTIGLG